VRVSEQGVPHPDTPPLLLINGIGAALDLFEPLRDALGDRQTIAFDIPGVGGSPTPLYPPTMRWLAGLVAGLVDKLGCRQVDVLGLSWGGALAQELARRHPHRVRRLVLAATMSGWTSLPGRPTAVAVLLTPARYYCPPYFMLVAPTLYGREIRQHPELLRRHAHLRSANRPTPAGYFYQLAALRRWTSVPWLWRLPQPTLVIAGDEDPIIPLTNARLLACAIPDARLHVVRGGGHLFLLLRAAQMTELLVEFLDEPADEARPAS
jgi:poly(3-hydroxyalkanoate) depolymerase